VSNLEPIYVRDEDIAGRAVSLRLPP